MKAQLTLPVDEMCHDLILGKLEAHIIVLSNHTNHQHLSRTALANRVPNPPVMLHLWRGENIPERCSCCVDHPVPSIGLVQWSSFAAVNDNVAEGSVVIVVDAIDDHDCIVFLEVDRVLSALDGFSIVLSL